ncbi:MAG: hypothetical protein OXF84_06725 [Bacteroidetes bacterium]|nr:hypothetical protein [Bacteroidota bacterium]
MRFVTRRYNSFHIDKNSNLEFSRISHLLRKSELTADEANELTERINNMASSSFQAEFDSFKNVVEGKLDSQNSKYNTLIWIAGFIAALAYWGSLPKSSIGERDPIIE